MKPAKPSPEGVREARVQAGASFQVRKSAEGPVITGYAARFNVRSSDLGGFVEEIDPKAFDRALREKQDCRALWNHNDDHVLGRVGANLTLQVDDQGLHYTISPVPDTQAGRDALTLIGSGLVDNSSFGFHAQKDQWYIDEADGIIVRRLMDVDIYDVSPVAYPAYPDASVQVRSEVRAKQAEMRKRADGEKRYRKILGTVAAQKWAILPEMLATIERLLNDRASGKEATAEEIRSAVESQHGETPQAPSVAVIPVYGPIAQRMGMFDDICGGASCEAITNSLRAALADDSVSSIVLDIDSPGGTVTGVPELAAEIFAARGKKPIIAVANGMAASAAYWIASAADKLVVTPSGEVGSIGVYTMHQDISQMLKNEGVKVTFIQAGEHKTDGNPYEPLSDEAQADMQDGVDKFYDMFTRGVAKGRGVSLAAVLSDFGQGRMLLAEDAVAAGMADEINSLGAVLAELGAGVDPSALSNVSHDDSEFDSEDFDDEDDNDDDEEDEDDDLRRDVLRIRSLFSHQMNA